MAMGATLPLLARFATDRLEAFVFATRLTRISRQLRRRNVDQALREAVSSVVDWGGGTRIGESFKRFNYVWARRVLGRGSVVAILSDAWDRGDVDLLERVAAVRDAFAAARGLPGRAAGPVVLVDDVVTTGSTSGELARILKRAGAERVEVWAAARALSRHPA